MTSRQLRQEFASKLRQYRVPRGFKTARMFAQALQIDENRYTRYERAEVEPDLALLVRMCTLLGVTPNDVLGFPSSLTALPAGCHGDGRDDATQSHPGASDPSGTPTITWNANRSLAWRIACQLTPQPPGGPDEIEPMDLLRRTSQTFAEIEADPFAFAARAAENQALAALPKGRQAEIVSGLNELLSGTDGGPDN